MSGGLRKTSNGRHSQNIESGLSHQSLVGSVCIGYKTRMSGSLSEDNLKWKKILKLKLRISRMSRTLSEDDLKWKMTSKC